MKNGKLMSITFIFVFTSWLILVYIFGIIFNSLDFNSNQFLHVIFTDRDLLKVRGTINSGFNGNTIFDIVLLFIIGSLWKKYFYLPRITK